MVGMDNAAGDHIGQRTHDERARVPDEHLVLATEDITDEEWDESAHEDDGEQSEKRVVMADKIEAQDKARHNAQTGGKTVHPVDHIQGIHQSHTREERKQAAPDHWDVCHPKEADKGINSVAEDPKEEDNSKLDHKLELVVEIQKIVEETEEEHHRYSAHDHIETVCRVEEVTEEQSDDECQIDTHTAQHWHGPLLQLTPVRIVGQMFLKSQFDNEWIHHDGDSHSDESTN